MLVENQLINAKFPYASRFWQNKAKNIDILVVQLLKTTKVLNTSV